MLGTIFASFLALALVCLGLALLVWWLWSLWKRSEEETSPSAIEIKAEASAKDLALPAVEAGVESPAEDIDLPAVEPEAEAPAKDVESPEVELDTRASAVELDLPAPDVQPPVPPEPDDLKRIEGIGPRMASVLQDAGISTFAELANTPLADIEQVLENADPRLLRLAVPETWIEQASLAAIGDWDALDSLQDKLQGGRRV